MFLLEPQFIYSTIFFSALFVHLSGLAIIGIFTDGSKRVQKWDLVVARMIIWTAIVLVIVAYLYSIVPYKNADWPTSARDTAWDTWSGGSTIGTSDTPEANAPGQL